LFYCEIKNLIGKTFSGASATASASEWEIRSLASLSIFDFSFCPLLLPCFSTFSLRARTSVHSEPFFLTVRCAAFSKCSFRREIAVDASAARQQQQPSATYSMSMKCVPREREPPVQPPPDISRQN